MRRVRSPHPVLYSLLPCEHSLSTTKHTGSLGASVCVAVCVVALTLCVVKGSSHSFDLFDECRCCRRRRRRRRSSDGSVCAGVCPGEGAPTTSAGGRGRGPPSRLGRVDWVADEGGFARRQERRTRIEHTFATLAHIEDPLTVRIDPKTTAMPLCLCDNGDDIAQSFTAVRRGA